VAFLAEQDAGLDEPALMRVLERQTAD